MDTHWTTKAACRGQDPEIFFPEIYYRDDRPRWTVLVEQAREICARCPVRIDCLDDAMRRKERHGIWGGLLPHEREHLNRRPA